MSYINPTPYIAQLKTQLEACPAWIAAGGVDANIHYPSADAASAAFPAAILTEENVRNTKVFYGAAAVPSGDLSIILFTQTSTGLTEALARDIAAQICVDNGLANLSVTNITPSTEPPASESAVGVGVYDVTISLTFGLEA